MSYTDEAFREAVSTLCDAVERLRAVRHAIDVSEPLRDRIDGEIAAIEASAAELARVLDEAIDELL